MASPRTKTLTASGTLTAFEHEGQRIFWKIDHYDRALTYGSENAADPQQTVRVLTIMLASEY